MVQFIRLRGDFWAGFISDHRTASQLLSQREAARMVPIFAQPIILAYGACALAKICRHLVGAWLYAQLAKNLPTSTIALDPYEFRSLQGVLIKRRSLISF